MFYVGNTTNDGVWSYTWRAGRQLAGMSKSGTTVSFAYDANGLRTRKTVNGTATEYTLHGKLLTHMKKGNDQLHFYYDEQSRPAMVNYNGTIYTYVHNLQGDIVAIVDSNGNPVVEYWYDAWGKPLKTTGTLTTTLGALNPFRYRGYIFDEETGLYYLRSRYYNPIWGSFINLDKIIGEHGWLFESNLFAYCKNTPVSARDSTGCEAEIVYEIVTSPQAQQAFSWLTQFGVASTPVIQEITYTLPVVLEANAQIREWAAERAKEIEKDIEYRPYYIAIATGLGPPKQISSSLSFAQAKIVSFSIGKMIDQLNVDKPIAWGVMSFNRSDAAVLAFTFNPFGVIEHPAHFNGLPHFHIAKAGTPNHDLHIWYIL